MTATTGEVRSVAANSLEPGAIRRRHPEAFELRHELYWFDMVASALLGWCAFALSLAQPLFSPAQLGLHAVAVLAFLRGALFIHELSHLRRGAIPGFELSWHALVGIPVLVPSLMYVGSHGDHHRTSGFATPEDPEYAPIATWSRLELLRFLLGVVLVPALLVLRWGLLGPISYLVPPLRSFVVAQISTLVINSDYRRPLPQGAQTRRWAWQEAAAALAVWTVAGSALLGAIPASWLVNWYLLVFGVLFINQVRTLAAHRYENLGEPLDTMGQLLDSVNLRGLPGLTVLAAPVGLRYHALHHLLPTVPYHSLGWLHRALLEELPADTPYRRSEGPGILSLAAKLWRGAGAAQRAC